MKLDEFQLIRRLTSQIKFGKKVLVGPGDDCAVVRLRRNAPLLLTTDLLIEGVHFELDWSSKVGDRRRTRRRKPEGMTPEEIGFKAMRVNLSDIAAMGGLPRFTLLSVGLPRDLRGRGAERLFQGLRRAAEEAQVTIIGGDTNASHHLVVNVAVMGEVPGRGRVLTRKGARVGDHLYVTGTLGGSALGLAALRKGRRDFGAFVARHKRPPLRVSVGLALARLPGVHAMIDLSDGLAGDLRHLLEGDRLGADVDVETIPVPPGLAAASRRLREDPLRLSLEGGEDYELLFAVSPRVKLPRKIVGVSISKIGKITPKSQGLRWLRRDGIRLKGAFFGFRHF